MSELDGLTERPDAIGALIAKAVYSTIDSTGPELYDGEVDRIVAAVKAALDLRPEVRLLDDGSAWTMYGPAGVTSGVKPQTRQVRYATPWETRP